VQHQQVETPTGQLIQRSKVGGLGVAPGLPRVADDAGKPADAEAVEFDNVLIEEGDPRAALKLSERRLRPGITEDVVVPGYTGHPPAGLGETLPDRSHVAAAAEPVFPGGPSVQVARQDDTSGRRVGQESLGIQAEELLRQRFPQEPRAASPVEVLFSPLQVGGSNESLERGRKQVYGCPMKRKVAHTRSLPACGAKELQCVEGLGIELENAHWLLDEAIPATANHPTGERGQMGLEGEILRNARPS
jgi:hypothetical protein